MYSFTDENGTAEENTTETNTIYVTESGEYFYQADAVSGQVVTLVDSKCFLKLRIAPPNTWMVRRFYLYTRFLIHPDF